MAEMVEKLKGRKLRSGYTTGACAASAAKAATQVLLAQIRLGTAEITLPNGQRVCFPLGRCEWEAEWAEP